ncbi:MAG TPA: hypothetical protein VF988_13830 [Verrucomicrobiae bacterium]
MSKKNGILILCAVAMAVIYAVWFTNWFEPSSVKIFHTHRNPRPNMRRGPGGGAMPNLIFGVNHPMRFTELKVVSLSGFETNKNVLPVWHLVSDSNSVPVKTFFYGQFIGGMRPMIKGVRPEPLESNVTYRMFISAGKLRGEHDFALK